MNENLRSQHSRCGDHFGLPVHLAPLPAGSIVELGKLAAARGSAEVAGKRRAHLAAALVGSEPELGFEAEIGGKVVPR